MLALALPAPAYAQTATVLHWSDGDTVVTTAGKVRLIGIDAPEKGECGFRQAKKAAKKLAPKGTVVRLANPKSVVDLDKYDRLLRYVNVGKVDVGLEQIKRGSVARYDSLDGYDHHPRQKRYRSTDVSTTDYCVGGTDLKSYSPVSYIDCPANAPIKGNVKTGDPDWDEPYKGIYHLPGHQYYDITQPEECFATEAGAVAAGYRKSQA